MLRRLARSPTIHLARAPARRFSTRELAAGWRDKLEQNGNVFVTVASLAAVCSFACEDVLYLRSFAVTNSTFFAAFYLTRRPVMLVPLGWGSINIAINSYMISKILRAREAAVLSDEEHAVYEEHFMPFGVTSRLFKTFWDAGARRELRAGDAITREGVRFEAVTLVVSGPVERTAGGRQVAELGSAPGARLANPYGDCGAWVGELRCLAEPV